MPKEFKYDVVQLIEAIHQRPCIWDKSLECHKDRVERRTAWEEIFSLLDERYEDMCPEEKRMTGEIIIGKWTNIRDTFVKSLKSKMGRPKRKYLFYDHLKFLLKIVPEEEWVEEDIPVKQEVDAKETSKRKRAKRSSDFDYSYSQDEPASSKDTDYQPAFNDIDFIECEEIDSSKINDPRVMNEDEAFFASLLPTVVRYNEDERLEFRIEVLAIMKRIKQNRQWQDE
ncbi:hypothetical protein EVAR_68016_1 [Eumeta japonica]|uniref:MADF domain-containing protein n=1 Tax=Eumeta variegata TaxID=151549 RepID=A0A4C1ZH11_EUMVA|nr:hypothetical protein EVAR_68016_1 [Eumeta japonica]